MDKPIEDWLHRLRGMDDQKIVSAWKARAKDDLTWQREANFHAAAAERMKQLGNMAIDLDDKVRLNLCRQAEAILDRLQRHLSETPDRFNAISSYADERDAYYQKYGTRTSRYYMFEQGLINELGDRQKTPARRKLLREG